MTEGREYILGTDQNELERLGFQHKAWTKEAYRLWEIAGIETGQTVLDLGSGPGFTSFELAHVVGPRGRVIARDLSARFIEYLGDEARRLGHEHVEPSLGAVEDLDLEDECLDAAYARWLFCWLPEPDTAFQRVAKCLKPGAALVVQDYLDWGAMALNPRSVLHERIVEACLRSWVAGRGTIDICAHIPKIAARCGLVVEYFRPVARLGAPGSLEWRWLGEFYGSYLPKLVERGLLDAKDWEAFRGEWARLGEEGESYISTPTMADVVLRKPRR